MSTELDGYRAQIERESVMRPTTNGAQEISQLGLSTTNILLWSDFQDIETA